MKRIVFLTGTRADFGKLKSLMKISQNSENYEVHIFVTGMHLNKVYGSTVDEIYKEGFENIYRFINHDSIEFMDRTLAKTIDGFSHYISQLEPDLVVVHGDRVEALAGAIVGSLNNILVAHIEGGEISGTIDELIRHSVSKMSHIHLVANEEAKGRLIQLGEFKKSVFVLGSPDLDLMDEKGLPSFEVVKTYYEIPFDQYAIAMFHPITTEYNNIIEYTKNFVKAILDSGLNYVLVYPNNDIGTRQILEEYEILRNNEKIRVFPSLRFEYFLRLLQRSQFIIGNSSAGIREAPYYNVPTVDIGTRQNNRAKMESIIHSSYEVQDIMLSIRKVLDYSGESKINEFYFGKGKSDKLFLKLLDSSEFWGIEHQKQFQEIR